MRSRSYKEASFLTQVMEERETDADSEDLRQRVVHVRNGGVLTREEIADQFQVRPTSTVICRSAEFRVF